MEEHNKRSQTEILRSLIISNSPSSSKPSSGKGLRPITGSSPSVSKPNSSKGLRGHEESSLHQKDAASRSPKTTQSPAKFLSAGGVRLTHSAPKEKVPLETSTGSEVTDTPSKPEKKAVFFHIAQRKDILPLTTVSLRRDVNIKGPESNSMKQQTAKQRVSPRHAKPPPRSRSKSPSKRKTQAEVHFKPEKMSQAFPRKDNRLIGALHSSENSIGDRKVVSVAHCEVFALPDKSNKLSGQASKSSNSLNGVPRPVAAFPSKPLKSTSFMIGRRKNRVETTSSTTALSGVILSEDINPVRQSELSIYSNERQQKDGIVVPSNSFTTTQSMGTKVEHKYGVLNSSLLLTKSALDTTPVPHNSCKTSMVGSDIVMIQDTGMATNKVSAALESLFGEDTASGKNDSQRITTATTKTLETTSKSKPTTRETSKYSSLTKDSKSSTSPKGKKSPSKYQTAQERYKSIIMDIYKKKGKDIHMLQNPMWKQGLSRSSSFGSKEEAKHARTSGNKRQSSVGDLSKAGQTAKVTKEGHIGGKKINPKPLSILGSKGGRDIIFSPLKGMENDLEIHPETIRLKAKEQPEPMVKDSVKIQESEKVLQTKRPEAALHLKSKSDVPRRKQVDDMQLIEMDETDESGSSDIDAEPLLQETSSFRNINTNLSTKMVEYGRENGGEAMFTAGHYVDFQHAKFNRKIGKPPIKIPSPSYTDDVKTKFLKVKVGGNGDGKSVAE